MTSRFVTLFIYAVAVVSVVGVFLQLLHRDERQLDNTLLPSQYFTAELNIKSFSSDTQNTESHQLLTMQNNTSYMHHHHQLQQQQQQQHQQQQQLGLQLQQLQLQLPLQFAGNNTAEVNITAIRQKRQQRLDEVCARLSGFRLPGNTAGPSILIARRLQVLYCQTGKVATSTWQRVLLQAAGQYSDTDKRLQVIPHHIVRSGNSQLLYRLMSYNPYKLNLRFGEFFKFMFVRHPFERLVSAYREKFVSRDSSYLLSHGRGIIRKYRHNATRRSLKHGDDVRFEEFVQYIIQHRVVPLEDFHWRLFVDACLPCNVKYDIIGHYETLQQDASYVLQRLGVASWLEFPAVSQTKLQHSVELTRSLFKDVPQQHIDKLKQVYKNDFELFGYDPHQYDHV